MKEKVACMEKEEEKYSSSMLDAAYYIVYLVLCGMLPLGQCFALQNKQLTEDRQLGQVILWEN